MGIFGVHDQTLAHPVAEIAKAPDRADLVAALLVLDHALADTLDIGGIVVEVADQRPHGFQGMIEHGAVVGGCHVLLPIMITIMELTTHETHPISERLRRADDTPSPCDRGAKPPRMPHQKSAGLTGAAGGSACPTSRAALSRLRLPPPPLLRASVSSRPRRKPIRRVL